MFKRAGFHNLGCYIVLVINKLNIGTLPLIFRIRMNILHLSNVKETKQAVQTRNIKDIFEENPFMQLIMFS